MTTEQRQWQRRLDYKTTSRKFLLSLSVTSRYPFYSYSPFFVRFRSSMSLFSAEPTHLTTISASHLCWLRFFPVVERVNESTKPLPPVPSLRRNKGSEFSCMMKEAKMLGMALGIPSLDGCSMDCHKDWVVVRITAIFNLIVGCS